MSTKIIDVQTSNPDFQISQKEIIRKLPKNGVISDRARPLYERFLSDAGIETRCFGIDSIEQLYKEHPQEAIERFQCTATNLAVSALGKSMTACGLKAEQLDALIVTTCTGYLCPGLTSYISEALHLRPSLYSLDLTGLGCGAALPAMRAADHFLKNHPDSYAAVVSVEVCSSALFFGDEIDLILSNSIFADGAAACIATNLPVPGFQVNDFESLLWPQYREDLRFKHKEARLCNVISKRVPAIAAEAVKKLNEKLISRAGQVFDHIAVHPGGRRILDEIERTLSLNGDGLACSRTVLRKFGNMSSPSILFVLKEFIDQKKHKDKSTYGLYSFGAGFSAFGTALSYHENGA